MSVSGIFSRGSPCRVVEDTVEIQPNTPATSSRIELVSAVLPCPFLARQHSGELRFNVDGCAGGFGLRLGRVGGGSGWVIRWGGAGTLRRTSGRC